MGKNVVIIGGGAAGMMAAIAASGTGNTVTIVEKNEKLGKKLFITGKGRCNLTNAGDNEELMNSIVTNPKFMYSALSRFGNYDCMGFFGELGLPIKVERGNRVFPESDRAGDVIDCLREALRRRGVRVLLDTTANGLVCKDNDGTGFTCTGIRCTSKRTGKEWVQPLNELIIATGGCSYPSTGSTGDGYEFARSLDMEVTDRLPALVPLIAREEWVKDLQGLSLKNTGISVYAGEKQVYSDFGEMMFTHFGVTGPVILSASSFIIKRLKKESLRLSIDLKPALDHGQLDARILRDFGELRNKQYKNALDKLLPKKLIPVIIQLSGIDPDKKVHDITSAERERLVGLLKGLVITITGARGFAEAIITQGGVDVRELNPATMQSRRCPNVRFAGEVLDVDAVTGGFNLQVAWSTGYAAGSTIC
jgi:hypothetical protein